MTQAIHTLDLLISLAGLPVRGRRPMPQPARSTAWRPRTSLRRPCATPTARIGTIAATTTAFPGFADAVEIVGSKGTARLDGAELTADFHDGSRFEAGDESAGGGTGADPMAFPHEHHRARAHGFPGCARQRPAAARQRQGGAEGPSPDRGNPALVRDRPARAGVAHCTARSHSSDPAGRMAGPHFERLLQGSATPKTGIARAVK